MRILKVSRRCRCSRPVSWDGSLCLSRQCNLCSTLKIVIPLLHFADRSSIRYALEPPKKYGVRGSGSSGSGYDVSDTKGDTLALSVINTQNLCHHPENLNKKSGPENLDKKSQHVVKNRDKKSETKILNKKSRRV